MSLGIEERIYLVHATTSQEAFKITEKIATKESNQTKGNDWNLKFIARAMESYEMFERENDSVVEVYSSLHKNRKSVNKAISDWFSKWKVSIKNWINYKGFNLLFKNIVKI